MNYAIWLANYFKNSNNKFFIAKLHDQQNDIYGKYYIIAVSGKIW